MSFEDAIIRKIDRQRSVDKRSNAANRLNESFPIEAAHARAAKLLDHPDYSIRSADFIDLYGKENIDADNLKVKEAQKKFPSNNSSEMREAKRMSDIFEAIMLEQSELSNWLGNNVTMLKTAPFDDYFHGIDMTAEWQRHGEESNVLALGVDVTFSTMGIEKKLHGMRRRVDKGELDAIKYFKTADGTFRGERRGVPHVIIGASGATVADLARLWIQKDNKTLAAHPIKHILVEEMRMQLRTIESYARVRGQDQVADAYRRSLSVVENVRAQGGAILRSKLGDDRVFTELTERTRAVFRS